MKWWESRNLFYTAQNDIYLFKHIKLTKFKFSLILLYTFCLSPSLHLPIEYTRYMTHSATKGPNSSLSAHNNKFLSGKKIIIILSLEKHIIYLWRLLQILLDTTLIISIFPNHPISIQLKPTATIPFCIHIHFSSN